ncbi:MAG: transglycosylase SLT domain-containing protein [Acidobacteria bacterium]|nr:transglycosylase SLT domain-containing protein [Acidobacteriota bacterium]
MLPTAVLLAALATAPTASAPWRVEVQPSGLAEQALREAVAIEPPPERTAALVAVSERYPGTVAGGLARLATGLMLLEDERPEEALVHLAHADVQRTGLRDHALLGAARAQDALERVDPAVRSYLAAAREPWSTVGCRAFPRAAEILEGRREAEDALEETIARCPALAAQALHDLGLARLERGDRAAAAAAFDRLDREHPTSAAARDVAPQLKALADSLPPLSAGDLAERRLHKGEALLDASRSRDALATLRAMNLGALPTSELDRGRLILGRALLARGQHSEGRAVLARIPTGSPLATEAAWHVARDRARAGGNVAPYVAMADAFPGTTWAQRALRAAANHYQKDARDAEALPYWQRLLREYPNGLYAESAAWRVGWGEYRAGRFAAAAQVWERTARLRPPGSATPGLLYWAARSHLALGRQDRTRWLLEETVQRFKHTYHGMRALEQLGRLGIPAPPAPDLPAQRTASGSDPVGARAARLRQLLLIDRFDEAAAELRLMGPSPRVQATLAWVEWRRGSFRPAIDIAKQVFPHWVSAAGDHLPEEVWRIFYPLRYEDTLRSKARGQGLDPALVAGLILQESSFDAAAQSRAGARGLMQIMPTTGRGLARQRRRRYHASSLYEAETSLDLGTFYLRQLSDRFDGAAEKVLVGYNAGPRRVDKWTSRWPGIPQEEFIDTIPFTETRWYVRIVLTNREEYRRLYGLGVRKPAPVNGGAGP